MPNAALNAFLFVGFPYLMLALAIAVSILRFKVSPFTYSSLSSQFLENQQLYWGSNLWHWGILWVLAGHLIAFLFPQQILNLNAQPARLLALELTGLVMGLLAFVGILGLLVRRLTNARVRAVTSTMDLVLLGFLILQVATGLDTAIRHRWGSSWYATNAVPYLWSLLKFAPKPEHVVNLPWGVKLHILSGFTVIGLIPFTRLVHFLVVPIQYLWRKPQVVVWNRKPSR